MTSKPRKGLAAPTVISAHVNADFDALAAMIAASKLYPGATLIFPGSQEKNIRNFFIQSATYLFNFKNFKDIDVESVARLVLVDTRQRSRLAHIEPDDVLLAFADLADTIQDCPRGCGHMGPPADPECALDTLAGPAVRRVAAARRLLAALNQA